jgi:hypothetical protein
MQKRLVLLLAIAALLTLSGELTRDRTGDSGLQLERPSFLALASTAQAQEKGVNFLQQEAGISAYVKVGQTIDLAQVKGVFKTVETIGDQYIIGEVALPDLPEEAHPHVYVNKDGWIVAYYSKHEPASKITHWERATAGTTLEQAIRRVFSPVRVEEIKYYNFKYPQAQHIMLITEVLEADGRDTFYLKIPQGLQIFEASWLHYSSRQGYASQLWIDDVQINSFSDKGARYGDLTGRLRIDFRHTIVVTAYKGDGVTIVLIY